MLGGNFQFGLTENLLHFIFAGNMEGAKTYAQNAIRKKSEALNYLQLASRLDAVVARLEQQSKMSHVSRNMAGIVKTLNKTLQNAPLEKMVVVRIDKLRHLPNTLF